MSLWLIWGGGQPALCSGPLEGHQGEKVGQVSLLPQSPKKGRKKRLVPLLFNTPQRVSYKTLTRPHLLKVHQLSKVPCGQDTFAPDSGGKSGSDSNSSILPEDTSGQPELGSTHNLLQTPSLNTHCWKC